MDSISSIETATTYSIHDKLKQLLHLEGLYSTCRGTKDSIYARILHRLGNAYINEGDWEKGIFYTKEAVRINQSSNRTTQKSFLCNSFFNLGSYYKDLNDIDRSIAYYDSCIQIGKYFPEKNSISLEAFEKTAFLFFFMGDYEKSIEVAEEGILFSKQAPASLVTALFFQLAQSQIAFNQTEKAEKNIKKALEIIPDSGEERASAYFIYAGFFKETKKFDASIKYYNKALDLYKQHGNWIECSNCLTNLGICYHDDLNNPEKAIECYKKAIQIQKTKDKFQLVRIYNNIGHVYARKREYLPALNYFQKGLNTLLPHFQDSQLQSNPAISKLEFGSNDYYVYTLLANKGESFLDLYKKDKDKINLVYALKTLKLADQIVDRMRWNQFGKQSKLFWREKTKKMYEHAIECCYLLNDTEKAFFFFEKSRAALLSDKLNELGAKKYLTQEDQNKKELLELRLFSLQQKLNNASHSSDYDRLKQQNLTVQDDLEKFIRNTEHSNPIYYKYKYDTTVYTVQYVRSKLLKEDQSLIEYFNGDSSMYAFIITPHHTTIKQINFKDYKSDFNELLKLCSDKSLLNRDYSVYRKLSNKIYTHLYKSLSIDTKRVIISPDGDFIPFDLLLKDSTDDNSFLLKDFAFSYTYSVTFLIKNKKRYHQEDNIFLGIAPVNYLPALKQQPLINSEQSINKIGSYFSSATLLINENATKKQFLDNLPTHTIVQLYTHAYADNTGKEPIIYFSDSILKVSELQFPRDKIAIRLIVLSACNTAVGKNMKGEGIFSFAREIAAVGIPSTVATLWSVDNQSTYQLTELFQKYLSEGITGDVALQKAKIEFLNINDVGKQLPYFWAATILIGETNIINKYPLSKTSNYYPIAVVSLLLFLALGIGLKLWKRGDLIRK